MSNAGRFDAASLTAFINATTRLAPGQFREIEPTVAAFDQFAKEVAARPEQRKLIEQTGFSWERWCGCGHAAWLAWSLAQQDYNDEAPLRLNASAAVAAEARLSAAITATAQGRRVLSDQQRADVVAQAHEDEASARQRADNWRAEQSSIRRQIAATEAQLRHAWAGDDPPPDARPLAPPALPVPSDATAFIEQRRHDLQTAVEHEADELHQTQLFAAIANDPLTPANDAQKRALTDASQRQANEARATLRQLSEEKQHLVQQTAERARIAAEAQNPPVAPEDLAVLRKQLTAFNALWNLDAEGRRQPEAR